MTGALSAIAKAKVAILKLNFIGTVLLLGGNFLCGAAPPLASDWLKRRTEQDFVDREGHGANEGGNCQRGVEK